MGEQKKEFHALPKTLNKKELSFYVQKNSPSKKENTLLKLMKNFNIKKPRLSKEEKTVVDLMKNFDPRDWIQGQFEKALWEKPVIVKKSVKLWYSLQQIHNYIHRELQKVIQGQGNEKITNWNWYGELFELSNNLGIYIWLNKLKITKKDIQNFIEIMDSYQLDWYSGTTIMSIHWFDFLDDPEIKGNTPLKESTRNMSLIKGLTLWKADSQNDNFPISVDTHDFEQQYQQELSKLEKKYKGMTSIGWKIHFSIAIPEEKIEKFRKKFWFYSTPFKLIHANTSLLLPPSYFPEEIALMIWFLQKEGLIEWNPQLQLSIPSRLPNRAAGMLGSAMLLSSKIHIEYAPDAFKTSHDSATGSKIMAYDDGVLDKSFKGIPKNIEHGRTDMMWIKDISLIPLYHLVGTLLSHGIYKGKFKKEWMQFMQEYKTLLEKYQILDILEQDWVHIPDNYSSSEEISDSAEKHYEMIKRLTDIHKNNWEQYDATWNSDWLFVFELEKLLDKYKSVVYYNTSFLQLISNSCADIMDTLKPSGKLL